MTSSKKNGKPDSIKPVGQVDPDIPIYMKNNQHIISGFRLAHSLPDLLKSLFKWHNQTVNVWTHLIPAIIIFAIMLSSNLFVHHYHQSNQILAFSENLRVIKQNIVLPNVSHNASASIGEHEDQLFQMIVSNFLNPMKKIKGEIQTLIMLTSQDNLAIRDKIKHTLKKIQTLSEEIDRTAMLFALKDINLTSTIITSLNSKLGKVYLKLNSYLNESIKAIQKLSTLVNPIPKWPILVFVVSASLCLTFSSMFHLLYPLSNRAYKILRKLDYSGVVLLIIGSSVPPFIYGSQCIAIFRIYLVIISIMGLVVFVSLMSGYFDAQQRYKYKSFLFFIFGISFLVPIFHVLIFQNWYGYSIDNLKFTQFANQYLLLGAVYIFGLFIYTMRCPQRYSPGHFDHCGASHQIWHIFVVIGLYITYNVTWDFYYKRRITTCIV